MAVSAGAVTNIISDHCRRCGSAVGGEALMGLLKNYARARGIKKSLVVGVVGFPNTGKSSVINSLKRRKAVAVSPVPGCTKTLQEVAIDKKLVLIDSPGACNASCT